MNESSNSNSIYLFFRRLILAANILVFLVTILSGVTRSTGSAGACYDWPLCNGKLLPPLDIGSIIDYLHRLGAFLVIPMLLVLAALSWFTFRQDQRIRFPMTAALLLSFAQALFGRSVLISGDSPTRTAVSLGLWLLIQGALLIPLEIVFYMERTTEAWAKDKLFKEGLLRKASNGTIHILAHSVNARGESDQKRRNSLAYQTLFARLSLVTLAVVFLLLVSGTVVSASSSGTACPAWPLCSDSLLPHTTAAWIQMAHRLIVAAAAILVGVIFVQAWRTQRSQTVILVASTAVGVLFIAQALMGGYQVINGFPLYMTSLHEATAAAIWAAMIVQVAAVGMARRSVEEEREDLSSIAGRKGLWLDLLKLTKPIVVVLLLVTTVTGMVIGAKSWPSFGLIFWTLLGGAMAAGGSGAINQYIDRFDDVRMQRTSNRPIPAGRLTPGEGLAFGVGLALASFYLVVAFVNLLAALLLLAGIIYYVLIYSIFLKKTTVQNIVIGGGAGAIPPLVGWAAATGSLNVPSLFLFAVVFFWTPPHFWALALVRRNDYARAGVPMLPVVRGERTTRWQIFLYTIELVVLSLILPLFGLGSSLYLVAAAVLGAWLLFSAWQVWQKGGNKTAWKMYRYSSMYLAFIFFALMVDRLIY